MDVVILQWPAEEPRRAALRDHGTARLLLVDRAAHPPVISDPQEDWVRMPSSDADIKAKAAGLSLRCIGAGVDGRRTKTLAIDDDGILRRGDEWVSLPPIEAEIVRALLATSGSVVSRAALQQAAWPGRETPPNTLDVHMARLRRRIAPLEVMVRTVRSRGYIIDN